MTADEALAAVAQRADTAELEVRRLRARNDQLEARAAIYAELRDAALNVVAQWRGDISRKPHIGRLRDVLAKLPR